MTYNNVENLLNKCKNPETYNFEFECSYEDYKAMSPLKRFLVYKSTFIGEEISKAIYNGKDNELYHHAALFSLDNYWRYPNLTDCDGWDGKCGLAVDLYKTLWNWKPYPEKKYESQFGIIEGLGSFGGDTLNSVQTTMNGYLKDILDNNKEYQMHMEGSASTRLCLQLYCVYAETFEAQFEKKKDFIQYIELCHTLGNLGLVPAEYNGYRGTKPYIRDYSDLSFDNLLHSRDGNDYLGKDSKTRRQNFIKYINTSFFWDYVDKNYEAKPLCVSHKKKMENWKSNTECVLPEIEELDDLCRIINNRIERRSIFMTAMLRIALGINISGEKTVLKYEYSDKNNSQKWADWNVSGVYKKIMNDVFLTEQVYVNGFNDVIKAIEEKTAGNPDEEFVSSILNGLKPD